MNDDEEPRGTRGDEEERAKARHLASLVPGFGRRPKPYGRAYLTAWNIVNVPRGARPWGGHWREEEAASFAGC